MEKKIEVEDVYKQVIRDVVKRLADELVEMYGEENEEKQAKIKKFLEEQENHLVQEVFNIENLFEQIEVATNDVTWPYLNEFLVEIEKTA